MTLRLLLLSSAVGLAGCLGEAPHDNPLDPLSEAYRDEGTVAGRVTGIYPPFAGRAGIRVRIVPLDGTGPEHAVTTGSDGAFSIDELPGGRYAVRAEGAGFRTASDTLTVTAGGSVTAELRLDALPVVTAQSAHTVHIERWVPDVPVFRLEVEAEATDPDRVGDLAGAALVASALGFRVPLVETTPGRFAATLDAASLPGGRVQSLLGQTLHIEAVDLAGNVGAGPPLALVRVIEQTPLTFRPQFNDPSPPNPPTLEWRPSDLPFPFTYTVETFLVDPAGIPNRVAVRDGLPSTATAHALTEALAPGRYSWTVWVVDEAGNRSRSREAGFIVP